MAVSHFALFATAIGHCGLVWSECGLVAVHLPELSASRTRACIRERFPESIEAKPDAKRQRIIERVSALLDGSRVDLSFAELDFQGIAGFSRGVYEHARRIPFGTVISYGALAKRLGSPHAARAVGQALGRNPWPLIVPCHRVLAANGRLTGFSAPGGTETKRRLLAIEGVRA